MCCCTLATTHTDWARPITSKFVSPEIRKTCSSLSDLFLHILGCLCLLPTPYKGSGSAAAELTTNYAFRLGKAAGCKILWLMKSIPTFVSVLQRVLTRQGGWRVPGAIRTARVVDSGIEASPSRCEEGVQRRQHGRVGSPHKVPWGLCTKCRSLGHKIYSNLCGDTINPRLDAMDLVASCIKRATYT